MAEAFEAGDRVRVRHQDAPGHTRVPRYIRGRTGVVLMRHREQPLPNDVVAGVVEPRRMPVYTVRFEAADLFGEGDHSISVDLWEAYLTAAGGAATS